MCVGGENRMVVREVKSHETTIVILLCLFIFQAPIGIYLTSSITYLDELVALMFIPLFLIELIRARGQMWFTNGQIALTCLIVLFLFIGWLSWRKAGIMPLSNAVKDCFGLIKFFMTIGASWLFFRDSDFEHIERKLWTVCRIITTILFASSILDEIFHLWGGEIRYGIMSLRLYFGLYTLLAASLFIISAIFLRLTEYYGDKVIPWLLMNMTMIFLTLRTKAMVGGFILVILFLVVCRKRRRIPLIAWVVIAAIAVLVSMNQVTYYFVELGGESARSALNTTAPMVAKDYFPLGSGWASFASGFSTEPYSPVYRAYGIDQVWGMSPEKHDYITDCFWPCILAQTGIFGTIVYAGGILLVLRGIFLMGKRNAYAFASGLAMMVYLLISSTSESAFCLGFAMGFATWIGFLFAENNGRLRFAKTVEEEKIGREDRNRR